MEQAFTLESHFSGKAPQVLAIYQRLLESLRVSGEVHESPKKTSIHLDHTSGFAEVNTRQSYLLLQFRVDHKIDDPRISKIEQHSARRFMHTVRLESEADVDPQLLAWLKEAYDLAR